jgi:hypothetical protein
MIRLHKIIFFLTILFIVSLFYFPYSIDFFNYALDSSWAAGLNQSLNKKIIFGKDIIFTFGPYASVYTRVYDPHILKFTILGSLIMVISLGTLFNYFYMKGYKFYLYSFFLFLFVFDPGIDVLLNCVLIYIIPFILINCLNKEENVKIITINFLVIIAIGLLPLIKGTFIIAPIFIIFIALIYSFFKLYKLAKTSVISFLSSFLFLWIISNQKIENLKFYYLGSTEIIKGYSDAMSKNSSNVFLFILFYLIYSIIFLFIIYKSKYLNTKLKYFSFILYSILLFIFFKYGFIRDDGVQDFQFQLYFLIYLSFYPFNDNKVYKLSIYPILMLLIFYLIRFDKNLSNDVKNKFGNNISFNIKKIHFISYLAVNIPTTLFYNIYEKNEKKIINSYNSITFYKNIKIKYTENLNALNKVYTIPKLNGTVDIYPYDLSLLIASTNLTNHRPIFQSYSSYTPDLINTNSQFLNKFNSPDNILFRIQTIDNRLPSMDDGLSYINLIQNYNLYKLQNGLIYFIKTSNNKKNYLKFEKIDTIHFDEPIILSKTYNNPLFCKIFIEPTFLGKFNSILYKQNEVYIVYFLKNKQKFKYRIIPNMLKTGIFLFPLINNTDNFIELINNRFTSPIDSIKFTTNSSFSQFLWKNEIIIITNSFINNNIKDINLKDSFQYYYKVPNFWWKPNETLTTSLK